MACISITCSPVGAPVQLTARQKGTPVRLTARPTTTPVQLAAWPTATPVQLTARATTTPVLLTCSLVCAVDVEEGRVAVQPQYVWLMEDNSYQADVDVLSNRNWTVG